MRIGVIWLLSAALCAAADAKKPNIVFFLADDLGVGDVGYLGSEIRTPHIDRLAAEGVRLDRHYAPPVCTPSRAALLTGRRPDRYGIADPILPYSVWGLPTNCETLARDLHDAGYFTAICGKWHLGHTLMSQTPLRNGFDHAYGCVLGSSDYFTREFTTVLDWTRNGEPLHEEGYTTDLIANETVRLIDAHAGKEPFFILVSFTAPHTPLMAPPERIAAYAKIENEQRRTYAAMVTALDDAVGRVRKAIEEQGLAEDTLMVFVSDNGATTMDGGSNGKLRGKKGQPYEGGVRVPAIVHWPKQLKPRAIEDPTHILDWRPTLLKVAGVEKRTETDGVDIWPQITGASLDPDRELLVFIGRRKAALLRGRWKLTEMENNTTEARTELFDLAADPFEQHDVSAAHPDIFADLTKRLEAYRRDSIEPYGSLERPQSYAVPRKVWGPY